MVYLPVELHIVLMFFYWFSPKSESESSPVLYIQFDLMVNHG